MLVEKSGILVCEARKLKRKLWFSEPLLWSEAMLIEMYCNVVLIDLLFAAIFFDGLQQVITAIGSFLAHDMQQI